MTILIIVVDIGPLATTAVTFLNAVLALSTCQGPCARYNDAVATAIIVLSCFFNSVLLSICLRRGVSSMQVYYFHAHSHVW